MTSQIDLCNRALTAMGSRGATISSFTEGTQEANVCSILFTPTFEALARAAPWNIFRKQAYLSLYKAASGTPENQNGTTLPTPPSPWLYSYLYPSDCLDVRYLLPQENASINTAVRSRRLVGPRRHFRDRISSICSSRMTRTAAAILSG